MRKWGSFPFFAVLFNSSFRPRVPVYWICGGFCLPLLTDLRLLIDVKLFWTRRADAWRVFFAETHFYAQIPAIFSQMINCITQQRKCPKSAEMEKLTRKRKIL